MTKVRPLERELGLGYAIMLETAGIIATLTSCNTAIVAVTHESIYLAWDGLWPRFLSRLGRLRTPYTAVIGAARAHTLESDLFSSLTAAVAEAAPTSELLVRRYEPEPVNRFRKQVKEAVKSAQELCRPGTG